MTIITNEKEKPIHKASLMSIQKLSNSRENKDIGLFPRIHYAKQELKPTQYIAFGAY